MIDFIENVLYPLNMGLGSFSMGKPGRTADQSVWYRTLNGSDDVVDDVFHVRANLLDSIHECLLTILWSIVLAKRASSTSKAFLYLRINYDLDGSPICYGEHLHLIAVYD